MLADLLLELELRPLHPFAQAADNPQAADRRLPGRRLLFAAAAARRLLLATALLLPAISQPLILRNTRARNVAVTTLLTKSPNNTLLTKSTPLPPYEEACFVKSQKYLHNSSISSLRNPKMSYRSHLLPKRYPHLSRVNGGSCCDHRRRPCHAMFSSTTS